jgi:hypothetical protein
LRARDGQTDLPRGMVVNRGHSLAHGLQ